MKVYSDFIASKYRRFEAVGFAAGPMTAPLFPFQAECLRWACAQGRAALFLDTGLGKTAIQLEWAHQVAEHAEGRQARLL